MESSEPKTQIETAPVAPQPQVATNVEPRNFLVTFLLAAGFGILGLRHFYLGDKKLGWTRVGLIVGGYAFIILSAAMQQFALIAIGALAVIAAAIWAIVDFFYVYLSVKTDASGQPLTATQRDKKWAKSLFIVNVVVVSLYILSSIVFLSYTENFYKNANMNNTNSTYDSRFDSSFNTY